MNRPIRETEFFTTAELAEKLKMNVQVITRKVKAGEIYAYKIGKDWRIPDSSVREWLDRMANREDTRPLKTKPKVSPKSTPAREERRYLLEYILAQLDPDKSYTEADLKAIAARHHQDGSEIYGELLTAGMIEKVGPNLRRREGYNLLAEVSG